MKFDTRGLLPRLALVASLGLSAMQSHAGFLEMPDTSEVPTMKRSSMLKDLDIPPVRDRDPDPTMGPRLNVTEFRVQGVVEYPELGITRKSLNKLVENIRFDLMEEGDMLESGYTIDEVSEISDLIAEIEDETQYQPVDTTDVQKLVFLIRDQRQRRGVTVGMIENVADVITRYYRERGFFLAKAYIPEQRVRDGIVNLTLLLGDLGEVAVLNNEKYKTSTVTRLFESVIDEPVTAQSIEERLYFVNDLPGFSAQAYFEAGSQVGDTKLNISVREEDSFAGNVRLDTHGSENTGENRLYVDGYWYNPTGIGDQLHIGVLGTFDPENSTYGAIHYGIPVWGPRAKFTIGGSNNDFVSTSIDGIELNGKSVVYDSTLNYILKRSRVKNYSLELRFAQIESEITTDDTNGGEVLQAGEIAGDKVRNIDLVFNFDVLLEKIRAMHQGGVRLTYGDFIEGRTSFQSETPLHLSLNYSLTKFLKVPFTEAQSRVQLRVAGQYSESALSSVSQFAVSGPTRLRGLSINHFNADSAAYAALDWVFNGPSFLDFELGGQPLSSMMNPYIFIEGAYGHTWFPGYDITTGDSNFTQNKSRNIWGKMSDIGFGLRFTYKNHLRANFSFAHLTSNRKGVNYFDNDGVNVEGINFVPSRDKVYFDMQYSF